MDKVLEQAKEMELKYRSKIIELEKELEFEALRASEYENKFKEAVMENSLNKGDEQLLKQLTLKEEESSTLRKQLADANRKLSELNNESNADEVDDLINQNNELRNVVEELKNAAIAAILEKDGEIEEMRLKLNDTHLADYVTQIEDKNGELENLIKIKTEEYEDEIKKINEKLANERNGFSEKLTKLNREMSHEENQKEKLMEKAQSLEGNLENLEKVIETYEAKMMEIENSHSSERINFTKTEYELQKRIDELLDDIKSFEKTQNLLNSTIVSLNRHVEDQKKKVEAITEEKEELDRKLKIKNRKANPKDSSKSIFESFEGFSQKADVFASFSKGKDLTRESFIGVPTKLSDIQEIEIEEIENFSEYIQDLNEVEFERGERKKSENIENGSLVKKPIAPSNKIKNEQIVEYEERIKSLLNEIDRCNIIIEEKTKELQKERLDKHELKSKSLSSESELKVEREGLKVHIFKLENALLIEKLQNAERIESNKEIREYEKKVFEEQILKLKTELEGSKKKKGLFGK